MKPNPTAPAPAAAHPPEESFRDPVSLRAHPHDELVLRDGILRQAKPGYPEIEYLNTPPIEVMGKNDVIELAGDEVAFLFRLNHLSDPTWAELFATELKDIKAEIQGAQLELRCRPADLERSYASAKAALEWANQSYAKLRAALAAHVSQGAAKHRAVADPGEQLSRKLRDQFERLEL